MDVAVRCEKGGEEEKEEGDDDEGSMIVEISVKCKVRVNVVSGRGGVLGRDCDETSGVESFPN